MGVKLCQALSPLKEYANGAGIPALLENRTDNSYTEKREETKARRIVFSKSASLGSLTN